MGILPGRDTMFQILRRYPSKLIVGKDSVCSMLLIGFAVLASTQVSAEVTLSFPISIPSECVELAQREGVPVIIENKYQATKIENKYQATKAKIKLARLSARDPLVRECRAAVAREKAALELQ